MTLLAGVLASAVGFVLLVRRYDRHRPAAWTVLLAAMLLGAASAATAGHLEDFVILSRGGWASTTAGMAAIAATHEELFKLVAVAILLIVVRNKPRALMNGLMFGAFVGLGFALEESFMYMNTYHGDVLMLGAEITRLVLHLLMGSIAAFGLAAAYLCQKWSYSTLGGCLMASLVPHFAWDYVCGLPALDGSVEFLQRVTAIGLMLGLMMTFGLCVAKAMATSDTLHRRRQHIPLFAWSFRLSHRRTASVPRPSAG